MTETVDKNKKTRYRIPTQIGHSARLRFRIAPVNKDIMNGDADWLNSEEFCSDMIASRDLFYPFIKKYFSGKFLFRNELNLMPFSDANRMLAEMDHVAILLEKDYVNKELDPLRRYFALDILIPGTEYEEKYIFASPAEKEAAVRANIGTVIDFYRTISRYMKKEIAKYEPLNYHFFAISSPA